MSSNKLCIESDDIIDWLSEHNNCDIKVQSLLKEMSELLMTGKMNDNKIHIKVESLVKSAEKTFENYGD